MYFVLAYYYIGKIENPKEEIARHKEFFEKKDFMGRIYVSEEGINGQASGSAEDAEKYIAWMKQDPRFQDVEFKIHKSDRHAFAKMTVKYRKQLVAVDIPVDFSKRGVSLSPKEWREKLEKKDPETLLIDVRNNYEWKVGHFEGAELPDLKTFREFPEYARKLKEKYDPKKTPIMMCCTGGIRCEFYSAVMKEEGFDEVYQLDGGIIKYGQEEGNAHWKGKLFVFDDRLVVPISEDEAKPISECKHCAAPIDVYYNCANTDCNDLFLCCIDCLKEHKGCCQDECIKSPRLRAFKEDAIPFRKLRSAAVQD